MDLGEEQVETCVGCGLTVEIESPSFLEWEADVAGFCTCPDCAAGAAEGVVEALEIRSSRQAA